MIYRIQITSIEPHPNAGAEMPRDGTVFYYERPPVFPATQERSVLVMDLSDEQFDAIRRAALEVAK